MSPHHNSDLPPRHLLDAWDVPGPPLDFEDRIMADFPGARTGARRRGVSANPLSLVVPLVAGVAAAALVLIWLTVVRVDDGGPPTPVPSAEPRVAPDVSGTLPPATERSAATLVLDVSPDAAVVEVDGRWIAGPAPFIATPLSVGEHRVRVRAEGRITVERTLELGAGTTELPISLASRQVVVSVEAVPPDADLTLEVRDQHGESRKETTNVIDIDRDPQARYFIEARASGHETRRVELGFDGNPAQRVTIVLPEDASATATPTKRGSPLERLLGAERSKPDPTDTFLPGTPPEKTGSRPKKSKHHFPFLSPKKKKPSAKEAKVRIGTAHGVPPAKVYIDGWFLGTTPVTEHTVKPGRHRVKWVWSDGRTVTQSVTLVGGTTKVLKAG